LISSWRGARLGRVADVVRIGNCSGFYGDRAAAMREMLTGGPLDVLTGDYLAELTMLILARDRARDESLGYARTFLRQLEDAFGTAVERGVRIVTNAGGLNPAGLAAAVRRLAEQLGLSVDVAHVEGDELRPRAAELALGDPLAANAYLGAFGIAECLRAGAQVVVTGRVTDASLVAGPAIAAFGWTPQDRDALAGAVVAGHVLECGPQSTGGNFAFFAELDDLRPPGFPIAEISADGSSVITKHPGTGGAVTVETVTAQLLYEIGGVRYAGPDVTARFDTIELAQQGPDRVRISGVRGEDPPPTLKVGLNAMGGYRNEVTFVLTGNLIELKARMIRDQLADLDATWTLARTDHPDAPTQEQAAALLHCVVRGPDPKAVGRAFSSAAVELALSSYPGFHLTAPPADAAPYGVFSAAYVDAGLVPHVAVLADGTRIDIETAPHTRELTDVAEAAIPDWSDDGPTFSMPLGQLVGTRSGDKGGDANVGVWARQDAHWPWLANLLTVDMFQFLLPESRPLRVIRHVLPNLRALNFVVEGLLGDGVAANVRHDPQAKALGEWLGSRRVDVPTSLMPELFS
jgi:Acyclic terpene utilisation family protein AtuA